MIIPSIIAKSQKELYQRIGKVGNLSKIMQLDIMDGLFVPTKSISFSFRLPKKNKYEAHLMVNNPEKWIKKNWKKVSTIIVHIESCKNPVKVIEFVKSKKRKIGLAINPKTPVRKIREYLSKIDKVLVMAVSPGYYGAKFLPETMKKVKEIRKLMPKLGIEVDGSVNEKTIGKMAKAGANDFIVGSFLQNNDNPKQALRRLKSLALTK